MADVVTLWSKTADFSAAVAAFPGVIGKTAFDGLVAASNFYGTNGTYLTQDSSVSYVDATQTVSVADTDDLETGMYAYLVTIDGGNQDGYYEILTIPNSTTFTIDNSGLDGSTMTADDTVDSYIGGVSDAFDDDVALQLALDNIGPDCGATSGNAVNNLDILCHASTAAVLTAKVDIDFISGSTTTQVRMTATDASFVNTGVDILEINTVTASLVSLFDFNVSGACIYTTFANFDFNANNGVGSSDTDYSVNESVNGGASDHNRFVNCTFRDALSHGVRQESDTWTFLGCSFTGNGGAGMFIEGSDGTENTYKGCYFVGNTGDGLEVAGVNVVVENCIIAGNNRGIFFSDNGGDRTKILNNTIYNNSSDGILFRAGGLVPIVSGNTSSGNTGFGYNFNGLTIGNAGVFGYNHAFGNSQPSDLATTDAAFQVFLDGHNITNDPDFETTTPGDNFLRPSENSPLLNAGAGMFNQDGYNIGALSPIAGGGAGGGGVMPLSGLLG